MLSAPLSDAGSTATNERSFPGFGLAEHERAIVPDGDGHRNVHDHRGLSCVSSAPERGAINPTQRQHRGLFRPAPLCGAGGAGPPFAFPLSGEAAN